MLMSVCLFIHSAHPWTSPNALGALVPCEQKCC